MRTALACFNNWCVEVPDLRRLLSVVEAAGKGSRAGDPQNYHRCVVLGTERGRLWSIGRDHDAARVESCPLTSHVQWTVLESEDVRRLRKRLSHRSSSIGLSCDGHRITAEWNGTKGRLDSQFGICRRICRRRDFDIFWRLRDWPWTCAGNRETFSERRSRIYLDVVGYEPAANEPLVRVGLVKHLAWFNRQSSVKADWGPEVPYTNRHGRHTKLSRPVRFRGDAGSTLFVKGLDCS